MSNLAKYEKWTPEAIEEDQADLASESDFLKVGVGRTVLRFLPPAPGQRSPFVKVFQHYIDIPGLSSPASFACPRLNGAKRACPACQRADQLRASGNPADFDLAGQLRASKRVYANVINRASPDRGPVIYAFGKTIHEKLISLAGDPDWGDFTDPGPDGYDITITRTGTGKTDTKYDLVGARTCTPLSSDAAETAAWLDSAHDLGRFIRVPSEEELRQLLPGFNSAPPARGPRRARRAQDDVIDVHGEES